MLTPVISIAILIGVYFNNANCYQQCCFPLLVFSVVCVLSCCCCSSLPLGSTPSRSAGFLGTSSPGPMADLYGAASQESAVSSYLSAASPAPSTGFSHSLGVSDLLEEVRLRVSVFFLKILIFDAECVPLSLAAHHQGAYKFDLWLTRTA